MMLRYSTLRTVVGILYLALCGCKGPVAVTTNGWPKDKLVGRVIQVALGEHQSCVLFNSGRVACWGDNNQGQLGDGSARSSTAAVILDGLTDIDEIRAADSTVCARRHDGRVFCWGANSYGQADPRSEMSLSSMPPPNGAFDFVNEPSNYSPSNLRRSPTEMTWLTRVVGLSLGRGHGCALHGDGRVSCWGDASRGQLGPGVPKAAFQRSVVHGIPPMIEVASASVYSCGRTLDGSVWCWGGYNDHGQLGTQQPGPFPRQVPGVSKAIGLELSVGRACAKVVGGSRICWGSTGSCGDTDSKLAPEAVVGDLGKALSIVQAYGGCFWCTLGAEHQLNCGDMPGSSAAPLLTGVATVVTGDDHACALLLDGSVQCWGSNVRGELGRRTIAERDPNPGAVQW